VSELRMNLAYGWQKAPIRIICGIFWLVLAAINMARGNAATPLIAEILGKAIMRYANE